MSKTLAAMSNRYGKQYNKIISSKMSNELKNSIQNYINIGLLQSHKNSTLKIRLYGIYFFQTLTVRKLKNM